MKACMQPGRVNGCPAPGWLQGVREHLKLLSPRSRRTRQGESAKKQISHLSLDKLAKLTNLGVCLCYICMDYVLSVPWVDKPE